MDSPPKPLFPLYTLPLTLVGFVLGGAVVFFLNLGLPLDFESTCLFRPLPPPPPAAEPSTAAPSPREWVVHEAAALRSDDTLLRVTKRLDLEIDWKKSAAECTDTLLKALIVETASDDNLIRVSARTPSSVGSADIVNAVVEVRGDYHLEKHAREQPAQNTARTAIIEALDLSTVKKRRALLGALTTAKLAPEFNTDAALTNLTLPPDLAKQRDEWVADSIQLQKAKAALAASSPHVGPRYADILEKAVPSMNPIATDAKTRMLIGAFTGAAAGLVFSILVGRLGSAPRTTTSSGAPGAPVEY